MSFRELLAPHASGTVLDRLVFYAELLERWSSRHNLVSYLSRAELVDRHLLDSLAGARLVEAGSRILDVGSGAGLPGVPLLCAVDGISGVLVEPRTKRWAFLRTVVRELELDAEVVCARTDELGAEYDGFARITARAVGHHQSLLLWSRPRLGAGGGVLLWVTEAEVELLSGLPRWRVLSCALPRSERGRLALVRPCST